MNIKPYLQIVLVLFVCVSACKQQSALNKIESCKFCNGLLSGSEPFLYPLRTYTEGKRGEPFPFSIDADLINEDSINLLDQKEQDFMDSHLFCLLGMDSEEFIKYIPSKMEHDWINESKNKKSLQIKYNYGALNIKNDQLYTIGTAYKRLEFKEEKGKLIFTGQNRDSFYLQRCINNLPITNPRPTLKKE